MSKAQAAKMGKLLADNPELSYRDTRDLLMEHGADGWTAGELAAGRE
jgi:hypothetical protein